jgi:H+/gluconate symporter-like permease
MNTYQSSSLFVAGIIMVINSLVTIISVSEAIEGLMGWNNLTGHLWVMLITGIIFCFIPFMGGNDKHKDEKLARMADNLKDLVEENDARL